MVDRLTTREEKTNLRFQVLKETQIYSVKEGSAGDVLISVLAQVDPHGTPAWNGFAITMLDMLAVGAAGFSSDYIAGGADDDQIFGQTGNDVIQGDGTIDTKITKDLRVFAGRDAQNTLLINPSFDTKQDGDEYIEGNSGNDTIFGNQGQDDIIGGSSALFSLGTPNLRADGSDTIFGGSGVAITRNDDGNTQEDGHARDADTILGDNGNIFRIVGINGVATNDISFNYDSYAEKAKIVVRGVQLRDYTPGGTDYGLDVAKADLGGADEIHGEAGDDFIFGMKGNDVLFGDAQNDSIVGGLGLTGFPAERERMESSAMTS
jgi:Ca2+-binding RTX toxin-like protein